MTTQPLSAAETEAAIRATLRRLARQLEIAASEAWKAAGEGIPGFTCRRHGWEDCEDVTCQEIAAAVASERQHLALAVRHTCACQSCKDAIASMIQEKTT